MRRLRQLEKGTFIVRAKSMPDSMSAWYLGSKGGKAIGAEEPVRDVNQNIVHHEVTLSAVRIVLESMGLGENFTTETELRKQYQWRRDDPRHANWVIPDGVFVAEKSGRPHVVALEIELTSKNHQRLNRVFTEYACMSSVARVLYVVGNASIRDLVIREWKNVRRYDYSPSLFVITIDDLKAERENAKAFDPMGIANPMHQVFDCKKSLLSPSRQGDRKTAHGVSGSEEEELSREAS
jgi:hypothetical protein